MLRTKTDIGQQVSDVKAEMAKQTIHHTNLEGRMDQTISDSKYWLEKYTSAFKLNDSKIGEMQGEFNGRMDTIFF